MSAAPNALELRGLRKTYTGGVEALRGIDLTVAAGDFHALLGPNGAGKSTTIGIIASLVRKTAGHVRIFGHDLDLTPALAKSSLGLVPQEFNFSVFETPWQIVVNQAGYYGVPRRIAAVRAERDLTRLGLWEKRHVQSRALSGGMKRRLMIARALAHDPQLLILDEPTAGVDIEMRRGMWDFLREKNAAGTSIILTTHYLEEAECLCRSVAIIDRGSIIENTTMKGLLATLGRETFVLDLCNPVSGPPVLPDHVCRLIDPTTLEVEVERGGDVNALFAALDAAGLRVASLRNKTNRLEELFLRLLRTPETVR